MGNEFVYPASLKTMDGTKWGYINEKGEFEIQPEFSYALDFQKNGLATIEKAGKYGSIDRCGNEIIPIKFESTIDFTESRAAVVFEGGFHVINEQGDLLTKRPFNYISMFQEGRAMFSDIDTYGNFRYGYLNKEGDVAIELQYETASDFKDGLAVVKMADNHFALIDRMGNLVSRYNYYFVGNYGEGMLSFRMGPQEKFGYINLKGNVIIQPRFSTTQSFESGRAVVNEADDSHNKYGLIDRAGRYIIEPVYNDVIILGENRVAVGKAIDRSKPYIGSLYAIANWKGELITEFIYDHISQFDQGIAASSQANKAFFIDRSGNRARGLPVVIGADSVALINNLVRAMKNTRIAYFDRKGKIAWRQNTIIPLTNRYRILEKKYEPNKDFLVFYPHVDGIKNQKAEVTVNEKLKQLSNVKEIDPNEQLEYTYTGDFNVSLFKKNLLVIELYGYEYYFGAAHGMPMKTYVNLNMISGRFYELGDLFKKDSHYIARLSSIIEEMIETDRQYDYVFPGAYQGITENQPFYVDENGLYIYFLPYEIAPYAAGFPTFKIPYDEIIEIIDTKGEFWLSFN
jgi:hypothetical protein